MKLLQHPLFWLGSYLGLVITPLLTLLLAPVPAKGDFWWEAGIAMGFAGLTMMALQFVLTGRLRKATAPFGIDVIYYFHRYLAYVLLILVLGHPLLLVLSNPALINTLNLFSISWAMLSGMLALLLLLLVVVTSAFRKALHIPYNRWLRIHLLLAIAALVMAFVHMWTVGYYSATPSVQGLWLGIFLSVALVILWVRVIRPWRLMQKPWTVSEVIPEQGESWTLTLAPQGHKGFAFKPGQFAWLSLDASPFAMREHPFSLASTPQSDGSLQFTIKELGDFTRRIGKIKPGTTAYVDGPHGVFCFDRYPDAPGYVFIAGGIGVAPILGMIRALAERGDKRKHTLFAAHSEWDRVPRRDEIVALAKQLNMTAVPVLENPPPDWGGESGWMTREMLEKYLPENYRDHEYFICGPQAMTDAVENFLHALQVPTKRIHTELFDMA